MHWTCAYSVLPHANRFLLTKDLKDLDMEKVSAEIKELGRRIDQELDELASKRRVSVAIRDSGK